MSPENERLYRPITRDDPDIIALATDAVVRSAPAHLSVLALNRPGQVADFIVSWLQTVGRNTASSGQQ
jgi:hypothetical protein